MIRTSDIILATLVMYNFVNTLTTEECAWGGLLIIQEDEVEKIFFP